MEFVGQDLPALNRGSSYIHSASIYVPPFFFFDPGADFCASSE